MHCKFLKLTNGEDIIVQTDDICDTFKDKEFINIIDPVLIASMRIPRGAVIIESYIMQPWIKMAKSDVVQLPTKNIIVAVDIHKEAEEQYLKYVEESNSQELDSANEIQFEEEEETENVTLEDYINSLGDDTEEEDDRLPRTRVGRILH